MSSWRSPPQGTKLSEITKHLNAASRIERDETELDRTVPRDAPLELPMVTGEVTRPGMALVHRILRASLEPLRQSFTGYDIMPFKIERSYSPEVECTIDEETQAVRYSRGRIWWAFRVGHAEEMPKNDLPNLSIIGSASGLELCVNAELQSSQRMMLRRVREEPAAFDRLLRDHGCIWLHTWLKLEHQPRFNHWIRLDLLPPEATNAQALLLAYEHRERDYPAVRKAWTARMLASSPGLTQNKSAHMARKNQNLSLALRLVRPILSGDSLWGMAYADQVKRINAELVCLKPLLELFLGS